ncbi:MAG: hypothetical protein DMF56_16160 [Acidobacteria bacterium]|nr:MAG: hypothetical protein DMF56_16160 [Acidobacteriota bacterium]
MDREIAPEVRRRRIVRRVAVAIIAVAAVVFSFAATIQWLRPSIHRSDIRIARVERGSVDATLQASGTIVPLVEQVVSSPVEARVLRIGRHAGDRVHAGDELLTLDTASTRLDAERLRERVAQKESESAQLRLHVDEDVATLAAQIEQKKLDVQILHYTSDQKSKLREAGLASEQEALAAAAAAKKSDIELRQLEDALARSKRSRDAQLAGAQMDLNIARREHEASEHQLQLAMLRAERDGVLTSIVSEEGATVRRGDILARVADLSSFRVAATISDLHAAKLAPGMRARVKLAEGRILGGSITAVDPRIEGGVVRFTVALDEPAYPSLRNNIRADVFVITGVRTNTLRAPRGALGQGSSEDLFVVRGDKAVRRNVRYGIVGDDFIEILDGVHERDEVVISNMNDYAGVKELRLK